MVDEKKILELGYKIHNIVQDMWNHIMDEGNDGWLKRDGKPSEDDIYFHNYLKYKGFDWFFDKIVNVNINDALKELRDNEDDLGIEDSELYCKIIEEKEEKERELMKTEDKKIKIKTKKKEKEELKKVAKDYYSKCGNCEQPIKGPPITSQAGRFCSESCEEDTARKAYHEALKNLNDRLLRNEISLEDYREMSKMLTGRFS